jgi:hypothetical protein
MGYLLAYRALSNQAVTKLAIVTAFFRAYLLIRIPISKEEFYIPIFKMDFA